MLSPQFFKYLARRANAAVRYIIQTSPDGFESIALRGNIQQALIRFGILNDSFCLPVDRKYDRPFCLLEPLHECSRLPPERC
jgi:hypothetical protein